MSTPLRTSTAGRTLPAGSLATMPPEPAADPAAPARRPTDDGLPARTPTTAVRVQVYDGGTLTGCPDRLVTEEPLEIRVQTAAAGATPIVITMRTPGHDFELTAGFLHNEGLVAHPGDITSLAYCLDGDGSQQYNIVTARLGVPVELDAHRRNFAAHSSCGVCGKTTLDQLERLCAPVGPGPSVAASVLTELPGRLRGGQKLFDVTGGLHAAAQFDASGELVAVREDVGRHNAVDKLVGGGFLDARLPLGDSILMVSGRLSYEIVQKAAMAGFTVLCAVSAPSSLAVATAARLGQTLVGFLRDDRFVVYAGPDRIKATR